jgi:carbonic anhydrase/acetyltransferase-like protein (isoleucine patch superfamily)
MIRTFQGFKPTIPKSCAIEETGRVIGDVVSGEHCSLYFHAVICVDPLYILIFSTPLEGEEVCSLTARVQRAQNSLISHQGMGQIAERFAEGAGTPQEFAEEESGN